MAMRDHDDDELLDGPIPVGASPFLTSHKAQAVCAREFARLTDQLVRTLTTRHVSDGAPKPVVRLAPNRCIVQVGPVAVTVAWLRSTLDQVAEGELLAIIWQGTVAARNDPIPERRAVRAEEIPVRVWEDTLKPSATSEATWTWTSASDTALGGRPSPTVADDLVARVMLAAAAVQNAEAGVATG